MLTIIAQIKIKPDHSHFENVINSFKKTTPIVLREEGCLAYNLLIDHDSQASYQTHLPHTIIMIEQWQSMQHLDKHLLTAHMQDHHERVKNDVIDVKINILENGFK
ncbi:putative quinol monooxygenase [Acinetobacter rudis]|uniref:putative quinol monooxygenase n=1 Tax=Acinetobacter rudis TaxID=632955 RepID=UPI00280C9C7D|nr:putative quinol monooxygenase [Acinetobacter rudis]MDQ8953375.1 putative quinol monooxygenase [Acinetobacter rudis]